MTSGSETIEMNWNYWMFFLFVFTRVKRVLSFRNGEGCSKIKTSDCVLRQIFRIVIYLTSSESDIFPHETAIASGKQSRKKREKTFPHSFFFR